MKNTYACGLQPPIANLIRVETVQLDPRLISLLN